jgi:hypothetical protein
MTLFKKLLLLCLLSISLQATSTLKSNIYDVQNDRATIDLGDLKIGSSGIVIHNYEDNKQIIVANAVVVESYDNKSVIKFKKFDSLKNDVLSNTNLEASNGDTFIANYLYGRSLLITPNGQTYVDMKKFFPHINFVSSDVFASYLKLEQNPTPQQKDFQDFCADNDLGTIYVVIEDRFYVVDAKSFQIVETFPMINTESQDKGPFYTRVEGIEKSLLDFDMNFDWSFGLEFLKPYVPEVKKDEKLDTSNYNRYYRKLLGLN